MFRFAFCAVMTLPTLFCGPLFADLKQEVLKAYRQRQEMVKTLEVRFRQVDPAHRGQEAVPNRPNNQKAEAVRPKKAPLKTKEYRLLLDQSTLRYDVQQPWWHAASRELKSLKRSTITDGKQILKWTTQPEIDHPSGMKYDLTHQYPGKSLELIAYSMAFRAFENTMVPYRIEDFEPLQQTVLIGGNECDIWVSRDATGTQAKIYLDRTLDYLPRRIKSFGLDSVLDIEYTTHLATGLIPKSWKLLATRQKNPFAFQSFEAIETRVNEPIGAKEIAMEFPPKTIYLDDTAKRMYQVLEDGTIVKLPYYEALQKQSRSRSSLVIVVVCGVLALGVVCYSVIRIRQSSSTGRQLPSA